MLPSVDGLQAKFRNKSFVAQVAGLREGNAALSRFLLAADNALARKGVVLRLATFETLHAIYKGNELSWNNLVPFFDYTAAQIDAATAACFVAYNEEGEPISTTAVRVWDLNGTNLKAEAESLRLFFGPNAERARTSTECKLTAPIATEFDGKVLYCGAYWVRPDWRGQGLGELVPAVSRYYALARWPIEYKITFGSKAFLAPNIRELYQYEDYQGDFVLTEGERLIFKGLLLWARRSFMTDRLNSLTEQLTAASVTPLGGNAQQQAV
jgi:GNAT superfamily N-acetyltransferase